MRLASLLTLALAGACASAGTAGTTATPSQTVRVVGPSGGASLTMAANDVASVQTLPFSADQVWRLLPAVLDSLGVPVETLDPAKKTIGNSGFTARHRLKGVPLSRYVDCGSGQMGPTADDYDVRLSLLVTVRSVEGGATVTTTLDGAAKPPNYAQEYSSCSSRGGLERRLTDILKARLAR